MTGLTVTTGLAYGSGLQSQERLGTVGLTVIAAAAQAVPSAIAMDPASPLIADTADIGSLVALGVVTMSDGSAFGGVFSLTDDDSGNFQVNGLGILVAAEPLSAGDHLITAKAVQNGTAITQDLTITVEAVPTRVTMDGGTRTTTAFEPRITQ